jgi:hypothetical protein
MKKLLYHSMFLLVISFSSSIVVFSQTTLTLQPGPEDGKDAHLSSLSPNTNAGDRDENTAMAWTNQGVPFILRAAIEFDLTSIPQGSVIVSALLSLYNNPDASANNGEHSSLSGPNTCWLSRITEEWDEHTVTWNNQPATTPLHQVVLHKEISPHHDYENINVTQLVQDMVDDPETGHGFLFRLITEQLYRCMVFASSDYTDSTAHPKLVITYIPPTDLTSVIGLSDKLMISVYPNPASDKMLVKISDRQTEFIQFQLLNAHGQLIMSDELPVNNGLAELNVADLRRGIYFLRIIFSGHSCTNKILLY